MKVFIVLALACVAHGQYFNGYYSWNPYRYSDHYVEEKVNNAAFGYRTQNSAREEYRDEHGNVAGAYSYTSPDGKLIQRTYTAGNEGFKQEEEKYEPHTEKRHYTVHEPVVYRDMFRNYMYGYMPRTYEHHTTTYRKVDENMNNAETVTTEDKTRKKRDTTYLETTHPMFYYNHPMTYRMGYDGFYYPTTRFYDTRHYTAPIVNRYYEIDDDDKKKRKKRSTANFAYNFNTPTQSQYHRQNNFNRLTAYRTYTPYTYYNVAHPYRSYYGINYPYVY